MAREKQVDLKVLSCSLPVLSDRRLLRRLLRNLVSNALKYTPPGSPIEIAAVARERDVRLTVEDHGPGLPAGREASLFQMFERGRKEGTTPGVGLGLAICRAVIDVHGGKMWAENRPGGGTVFRFTLPLESIPTGVETPDA